MLLKALKFMTLIHRQIECSQWDHQQFPRKSIFPKKKMNVLNGIISIFQEKSIFPKKFNCAKNFTICVAETEIMRKKWKEKKCLFKVEMKIWATAKRQKRASSADEAPLSNWKLTSVDQWSHIRSDFDLITQLSSDQSHIQLWSDHTSKSPTKENTTLRTNHFVIMSIYSIF